MWKNALTEAIQVRYPVIQAGMAGGPTTPELVAAVSNSGGLGTLGGGYMSPERLEEAIVEIRTLTDQPFAVNLFIPEATIRDADVEQAMMDFLMPIQSKFGLTPMNMIPEVTNQFDAQFEVVCRHKIPIFSFTFGALEKKYLVQLHEQDTYVIGTATSVAEAKFLEASGVDAVVAQGFEAGGHRGTFLGSAEQGMIGTMALIPLLADAIDIPVIAAGGIMNGRGLAAALALGAQAAQLGTAFLSTPESGANPNHKSALLEKADATTNMTVAYSGKLARGIVTDFMKEMDDYEGAVPAYPVQNTLTRDLRQAASAIGDTNYMSLWAGQAFSMAQSIPAPALVEKIIHEAEQVIGEMNTSVLGS